jgi:hypothetical protein
VVFPNPAAPYPRMIPISWLLEFYQPCVYRTKRRAR